MNEPSVGRTRIKPHCGFILSGGAAVGYLGEFEQLILMSVVKLGDGAYGGAIRDAIEQRTGRVVSSGAINTTLGRLADRKFVTWRLGEPTSGRPGRPRKYYALSPTGARALQTSLSTIRAMAGGLTAKLNRLAENEP
jgi:DNA-binding PadR family transcriptional regulator